jgi:RNA polymerase sigma-70 factor, ECF subfamily
VTEMPGRRRERGPLASGPSSQAMQPKAAEAVAYATDCLARYARPLYAYVRLIGLSDPDAQDVLQETFVAAWQNQWSIRSAGAEKAWIYRICRNAAYAHMRAFGDSVHSRPEPQPVVADGARGRAWESAEVPPARFLAEAEQDSAIHAAVLQLGLAQREVVVLHYFGGLSLADCAAVLELPSGTIKSRLTRGLAELKQLFLDAGIVERSARCEYESERNLGRQQGGGAARTCSR